MKAGFISIFGRPNAGKSTLMNALMGEKLAIVSSKVQTTRHRIKGIITEKDYQIILSDTPGIIEPKYKLHEKMMHAVKGALEDSDVAILLVDINEDWNEVDEIFEALKLRVPCIVVVNKVDQSNDEKRNQAIQFFRDKKYTTECIGIAALGNYQVPELLQLMLKFLPEAEPFFEGDEMSDLPTRFFIGEMVREKIYQIYKEEIPYHTTVLVNEFREKTTLTKIVADIIVQRETQKGILLGEGGKMIKQLGTEARKEMEKFLGRKVFLELFVKVRPKWRDNDMMLREYGYH